MQEAGTRSAGEGLDPAPPQTPARMGEAERRGGAGPCSAAARGAGTGRPSSLRYLILLLVVQLLGVGVRLPDQRVHQHQEGHVEQQGPHCRQVDDNDDLGRDPGPVSGSRARMADPSPARAACVRWQ